MTNSSLISVIMPSYNHGHMIGRAIKSVLAQTWKNFEIIIVDNHSSDNTEEVIREFSDPRLKFIKIHNNGVIATSRNTGIKNSKGSIIAFLDSDDWWLPNKLELSFAEISKGADLVYHDLYLVRDENRSSYSEKLHSSNPIHPLFESLLCTGISIPNSSVVVKKNILELAGSLSEDPRLVTVEDYDTWIRISKITNRFVRIKKILGYYWAGGGNMSQASTLQVDRIKYLYSRHILTLDKINQLRASGFMNYRIARVSHACGDITLAIKSYRNAIFSKITLLYKLKALFFLGDCFIKKTHG